jgi:hypothetical protein
MDNRLSSLTRNGRGLARKDSKSNQKKSSIFSRLAANEKSTETVVPWFYFSLHQRQLIEQCPQAIQAPTVV